MLFRAQVEGEIAGAFGMLGQGAGDQLRRLVQAHPPGRCRRCDPACQRFLEDGQGAGIEGDEQRHAGQDAGPGMERFVDADEVGSHDTLPIQDWCKAQASPRTTALVPPSQSQARRPLAKK